MPPFAKVMDAKKSSCLFAWALLIWLCLLVLFVPLSDFAFGSQGKAGTAASASFTSSLRSSSSSSFRRCLYQYWCPIATTMIAAAVMFRTQTVLRCFPGIVMAHGRRVEDWVCAVDRCECQGFVVERVDSEGSPTQDYFLKVPSTHHFSLRQHPAPLLQPNNLQYCCYTTHNHRHDCRRDQTINGQLR